MDYRKLFEDEYANARNAIWDDKEHEYVDGDWQIRFNAFMRGYDYCQRNILTLEDDGDLCIDLIDNSESIISISFNSTGKVSYAGRLSGDKYFCGTTEFKPEVFQTLQLINEINEKSNG